MQLFALRSQITKSHWFEQFNHDLLKFPPLVWVCTYVFTMHTCKDTYVCAYVIEHDDSPFLIYYYVHTYVQVVQDFVQATENNESPRQWLHRILESNSRESSDYDINLLGIYVSWLKVIPILWVCLLQ